MLTLPQVVLAFLTLFIAGLVTGLTGFGLTLIAAPVLLLFLLPKVVVPLLVLYGMANSLMILFESRQSLDLSRVWPLMLAGAAGVPLGARLLVLCGPGFLRVSIGTVIAVSAMASLRGFKRRLTHERLACVPVGLVSGLLNGSAGMAGPPVILFFANQGVEKAKFRASLAAYFTVVSLATVPAYFMEGLVTEPVAAYAALFFPAVVSGLYACMRLARRVNDSTYAVGS